MGEKRRAEAKSIQTLLHSSELARTFKAQSEDATLSLTSHVRRHTQFKPQHPQANTQMKHGVYRGESHSHEEERRHVICSHHVKQSKSDTKRQVLYASLKCRVGSNYLYMLYENRRGTRKAGGSRVGDSEQESNRSMIIKTYIYIK